MNTLQQDSVIITGKRTPPLPNISVRSTEDGQRCYLNLKVTVGATGALL